LYITCVTIEVSLGSESSAILVVGEGSGIRVESQEQSISLGESWWVGDRERLYGLDRICQILSASLVELIQDGFHSVVLVGHPCLLGRILVPYLSDGTSLWLVCFDEVSCSVHEDGSKDSGTVHCIEALLLNLVTSKSLVIFLTGCVSCFACHVPNCKTLLLLSSVLILSTMADGGVCRARFTISRLRDSHVKRSLELERTVGPEAFTVDTSGDRDEGGGGYSTTRS